MLRVHGILSNPFGEAVSKCVIRITPTTNSAQTIAYVGGEIVTGVDGSYSFNLKQGTYLIEVKSYNEFSDSAIVKVTVDTGSISLEELIGTYSTCDLNFPSCPVVEEEGA